MTTLYRFYKKEKGFGLACALATVVASLSLGQPHLAMWVGFVFAAYSVVANDSIQTIGTFLESNRDKPWWQLYFYLGGILVMTSCYSWYHYQGDVTFGRLASKGFEQAPDSFSMIQICAPLVLLALTRMAMPVSTTFLILSLFATRVDSVGNVVLKSVSGYGIAFACSLFLWLALTPVFKRFQDRKPHRAWAVAQWLTSGLLWSVWLMQDAANVAIYLPRQLGVSTFILYLLVVLGALALLVRGGGGDIQGVISKKQGVRDIRQATCIDLIYACILYYFKLLSSVPMSTTWVFIGLLAGRELGITLQKPWAKKEWKKARRIVAFDLAKVTFGLVVSILLALLANPQFREALF